MTAEMGMVFFYAGLQVLFGLVFFTLIFMGSAYVIGMGIHKVTQYLSG